jgi:hypothetical protein
LHPRRVGSAAVLAPEEAPEIAEQRMVQRLRELMRMLVRGLKAKKMYPANNPVLSRILNEMQDGVLGTIEDIGDLRLTVQQADLLYNGNSIYNNPSKRDSLAYRFHRDGITEIEFTDGVTPPEINAFLDVLARATEPRGAEEDLVTMLWEQEFSHIRYAYLAIDDLQENMLEGYDAAEAEGEEATDVPWPGQGEEPTQGLTVMIEGVDSNGERLGRALDDWNALIPAVDITERCPAPARASCRAHGARGDHLEHSRPRPRWRSDPRWRRTGATGSLRRLARCPRRLIVIALSEADRRTTQVLATMHGLCAGRGVDAVGFLPIRRIPSRPCPRSTTSPKPTPRPGVRRPHGPGRHRTGVRFPCDTNEDAAPTARRRLAARAAQRRPRARGSCVRQALRRFT